MSTQLVLGVAGAAIGFMTGGAAFIGFGFLVGSLIGSLIDPPKVEGPRLNDLKLQDSAYGRMHPFVWGKGRLAGNVIDQTDLIEHKEKSGGKGGPEVTSYTYSATFAIALCQTPIFGRDAIIGILRIWADGRLIWDQEATADPPPCTVYVGSEDQEPDPTLEAVHGVGNVPAYRGIAYVVFPDYLLTDFGNRIPQIEVEVYTKAGDFPWRISTFDTAPNTTGATAPAVMVDGVITVLEAVGGTAPFDSYVTKFDIDGNILSATHELFPTYRPFAYIANSITGALIEAASGQDVFWFTPNPLTGSLTVGDAFTLSVFNSPEKLSSRMILQNGYVYTVGGNVGSETVIGRYNTIGGVPSVNFVDYGALDTIYTLSNVHLGSSDTGHIYVAVKTSSTTCKLWRFNEDLTLNKFWDEPEMAGVYLHEQGNFHVHNNQICRNYTTGGLFYVALVQIGAGDVLSNYGTPLEHENGGMTSLGGCLMIDRNGVFSLCPPSVPALLSEIVGDLSDNTPVGSYDVTDLENDEVRWFVVASQMEVRNAIGVLRPVFFFDAVESDDSVRFVKRGGTSVATIPDDDLCGRPYGEESGDPLRTTRAREQGLPRTVTMTFIDVEADYQPGARSSPRQTTLSEQDVTLEIPVGMTGAEALQKCMAVHTAEWVEREKFEWATTRKWARLEPCDVVIVRGREIRILTRTETPGGVIKFTGVLSAPSIYTQNAPASGGGFVPQLPPGSVVSTELVLLDIPILSQADSPYGFYAAMGPSRDGRWTGATLYKSLDGGVTYLPVASTGVADVIGQTAEQSGSPFISGALGTGGGSPSIDPTSIRVILTDDDATLESVTDAALANGANLCAIRRVDLGSPSAGDWELAQFRDAVLVEPQTYVLSNWVRGVKGTETTGHADGDTFVLLPVTNVDAPVNELNVSLKYKAVSFGTAIADAVAQDFTNTGWGLKEWIGNLPPYTGGPPGVVPPPAGGPGTCRVNYVLNECGQWVLMSGGGGLSDGDKGDITVSGSGTVWEIDAGVVGPTELASTAVTPASYGSATQVATFTVDADGRLTAAANVTIQSALVVLSPAYSATLTVDLTSYAAYPFVAVNVGTLTGNVLFNITNGFDRQVIRVLFKQDGSGGRLFTGGANIRYSNDTPAPTLTLTANKMDRLGFEWHGADGKADLVALNKGY